MPHEGPHERKRPTDEGPAYGVCISYGSKPKKYILIIPIYEAERHRPAPRLWASFSRAAPRAAKISQK